MKIGNKFIGGELGENYTYIIAEAGVNHNGSLERAKFLIKKAAEAGADAIKFQAYTADDLVVEGTPKFWNATVDEGLDQYEAYKQIGGTPLEWYSQLMKECERYGIEFLCTPFSIETADHLNRIGMKAFKIASSDMSTLPFLKHIARYNKPILLSTGASTIKEIDEAVCTILETGNQDIVIMHCTLCYPTRIEEANLGILHHLSESFPGFEVGLSDHTLGITASIVGAAMGASVIEKHFTCDKGLDKSADHWLSVDPKELKIMVSAVREVETLKGSSEKKVFECEEQTRLLDKRSWVSKVDIKKGTKLTEEVLTWKRPGTGIWPNVDIAGHKTVKDIPANTTMTWEMLD